MPPVPLADFLKELHRKNTDGAPLAGAINSRRGRRAERPDRGDAGPPSTSLPMRLDVQRARALWDKACAAGSFSAARVAARRSQGGQSDCPGWRPAGNHRLGIVPRWAILQPIMRPPGSGLIRPRAGAFRDRLGLGDCDWLRGEGLGSSMAGHRAEPLQRRPERSAVPAIATDPVSTRIAAVARCMVERPRRQKTPRRGQPGIVPAWPIDATAPAASRPPRPLSAPDPRIPLPKTVVFERCRRWRGP